MLPGGLSLGQKACAGPPWSEERDDPLVAAPLAKYRPPPQRTPNTNYDKYAVSVTFCRCPALGSVTGATPPRRHASQTSHDTGTWQGLPRELVTRWSGTRQCRLQARTLMTGRRPPASPIFMARLSHLAGTRRRPSGIAPCRRWPPC